MPLRDKSLKPYGSATVHYDSAMPSLRFITTLLQLHHALLRLLLRLRACKPRNPADTRNDIQSKTGPSPECGAGWGGGLDAPGGTAASAPSPKHGAGGCAPAGGTASPPAPKTLEGGLGGTTASATKSPLPPPTGGTPWRPLESQWVGYSLFRDSLEPSPAGRKEPCMSLRLVARGARVGVQCGSAFRSARDERRRAC